MKLNTYIKKYIQYTNNFEFLNNKYFILYLIDKQQIFLIENLLKNNKIYFKILDKAINKICKNNLDIINNFYIYQKPNINLEYEEILTYKNNNSKLLLIFEYGKLINANINIIKYQKLKNNSNKNNFNINLIGDVLK